MLFADFADYGNAGASSVPHNGVRIQVAPLSFAFETIMANERINAIMNHELVHVIAMDQSTGRDRVFRRLFGGKVLPVDAQPESILFFYLTSPRVAAPRWYHEGAAVFIDTWESAGIGRAQSGYDEMVWRSMMRDHAHFYDPLGLAAEGTKIDFQVEVNSYLYGARFMTWLAYTLLARASRAMGRPPARQPRVLCDPVSCGVRSAARQGLGGLDRVRTAIPGGEPGGDPEVPGDDGHGPVTAGPRIGIARVL